MAHKMRILTWWSLLIIAVMSTKTVRSQAMQSILKLQEDGIDFLPANPIELMANYTAISSLLSCYIQCNMNLLCRTFVSDTTMPSVCRLYQGSIETGSFIATSSSTLRVAGLIYDESRYISYNEACDPQAPPFDRYLVCINRLWSCPRTTFWNGSMCLNQVYYESPCNTDEMCRQDIGLQCFSSCNNKCLCSSAATWSKTSCVQSTCPSVTPRDSTLTALWPLNGDARDLINGLNGTLVNNPSFVTGYVGQAVQCSFNVFIILPYIDFYCRSFTIELWFYRTYFNNETMSMFGECASPNASHCFHLQIAQNSVLYMGFFQDDCQGSTFLVNNQWYHAAFVYDYTRRQRRIYLNGLIEPIGDGSDNSVSPYLGQSGNASIGNMMHFNNFFVGNIDQVSITYRVKTADEILDDASLVACYSFDCGSTLDSGPNLLHGNATEQTMVTGRVNDALFFNSSNAFFQTPAFLAFGIANQSFSISLWMKPLNLRGVLVHVSNQSTGDGWCVPMLGFNSLDILVAQVPFSSITESLVEVNVWTHVVQTFSVTNGLRLYINGTLRSSGSATAVSPPYQPMYVTVASERLGGTGCMSGSIVLGSYAGAIDELRIYNREINVTEICLLSS